MASKLRISGNSIKKNAEIGYFLTILGIYPGEMNYTGEKNQWLAYFLSYWQIRNRPQTYQFVTN